MSRGRDQLALLVMLIVAAAALAAMLGVSLIHFMHAAFAGAFG